MDDPAESQRERRRRARATWPGGLFRLGDEPPDDLSHLSPEERISLVEEVTVRAWTLAGRRLPRVARSRWPGKLTRGA